jgi:hypothetical protein
VNEIIPLPARCRGKWWRVGKGMRLQDGGKSDYLPCMCGDLMMNAATSSASTSRRRGLFRRTRKSPTAFPNAHYIMLRKIYFVFLYLLLYICYFFR